MPFMNRLPYLHASQLAAFHAATRHNLARGFSPRLARRLAREEVQTRTASRDWDVEGWDDWWDDEWDDWWDEGWDWLD